jgi:hypothetical protein
MHNAHPLQNVAGKPAASDTRQKMWLLMSLVVQIHVFKVGNRRTAGIAVNEVFIPLTAGVGSHRRIRARLIWMWIKNEKMNTFSGGLGLNRQHGALNHQPDEVK